MRIAIVFSAALLAGGCSSPSNQAPAADATATTPAPDSTAPSMPASPEAPVSASAVGVVDSVDVAGKSLVISHEAVASLDWPPMTMTFKAPAIDLGPLQKGDHIKFDFDSVGMDGTVTRLERVK